MNYLLYLDHVYTKAKKHGHTIGDELSVSDTCPT